VKLTTHLWCQAQGMGGAVPPLPNMPSWRGAQLGGAQGQLYLYLYIFECKSKVLPLHEIA
jgi:hypothetical protein